MDIHALKDKLQTSPAFVVDEAEVLRALQALALLREQSGCNVLYSIKSLPLYAVLKLALPYVDGFSVSSLFEARLANEVLGGEGNIHLTTPGIRPDEIPELVSLCTHISCNSLGQYQRVSNENRHRSSIGLRINPQLSFTEDSRYDPCRKHSKLGVDINTLSGLGVLESLKGLHFHTVFGASDYAPLLQTLSKLKRFMGNHLAGLDWLNFGGGYNYGQIGDNSEFNQLVKQLNADYGLSIYVEPGNAVVAKAGYLVSTVIDCFESDGKTVAVLDTSVNHLPEVFEYQKQPELFEHDPNGPYYVLLAGSTCLAGDLFGEYRFARPLQLDDKVAFTQVGAYSLVKANRFNGYNLPDVYCVNGDKLRLVKKYSYQDYESFWKSDS